LLIPVSTEFLSQRANDSIDQSLLTLRRLRASKFCKPLRYDVLKELRYDCMCVLVVDGRKSVESRIRKFAQVVLNRQC